VSHRAAASRLALLLGLAVAAGCSFAPQYTRPAVEPAAAWHDSVAVSTADTSIANVSWWEMFPDSQLHGLVRTALAENQDLKIAIERIEEARARYGFSKADLYPQINAGATAGKIGVSEGSLMHLPEGVNQDTDQDLYVLGANLSWELDFFGRVRNASAAERAMLLAADQGRRAVVLGLVTDVASAYTDLRDLDRRLEISRRTLSSRLEYVDLARTRFEGGVAPEGDLRQAESEYHRLQSIVYGFEANVTQKEHEIAALMGRMPTNIQRGDPLEQQPTPTQIPAGLPSTLLERRPDIREAEEQLIAANARIGEAKALLFPRITLTGAFGWASSEIDNFFTDVNQSWNILGSLVQPLFNAGKNKRRVEVTQSQQRQAAYAYQRTVVRAIQEVEDALVGYRKAGEQRVSQHARVQAERKVLELAEARYRGGVADYLEVLDAQRSLYTAEIAETEAIQNHYIELIRIYKSLGGGWPSSATDKPIEESQEK
jgi:multidrug efflux system outer membrane protein